jgi:hypothetical protein
MLTAAILRAAVLLLACSVSAGAPVHASDETPVAAAPEAATPGTLTLALGAGQLGTEPLYAFRLAWLPTPRLGFEASLAHNPSSATHAALHHLDGVVNLASLGRVRPFAVAGLGTIHVFPGTALNAKSVTKLLLDCGGGTHLFVRDDVALRFEGRATWIVDQQQDHRGVLDYAQWSVGLTFFRSTAAP